jgi:alpha-glucosidase (family GH31 glycosyl hydrolase)
MPLPNHFRLPQLGAADPAAVLVHSRARFTILTERVIRLEYSPIGQFEDRESQAFWYRQQILPPFDVRQNKQSLTIITNYLELQYTPQTDDDGFTPTNLTIRALQAPQFTYHFGDDGNSGNLKGTYRTLDGVSGSTPLEQGLLSKEGWVLIDDSHSLVFNADGWLEPRALRDENLDFYFFGHGRDYLAALRDFRLLSGRVSLLPRWALGNWWSRYWRYSDDDLRQLMQQFQAHDVPLAVCIIDMDWHITETPYHSGWTGYTWNQDLFPDPPAFLAWLHDQGLKTALNLHPASGIAPHEEAYPRLAARLGIDPASEHEQTIPFDIANPDFALAYLEELHHPLEKMGVDFWWMDWQQGEVSGLPGLDPLWWLNHLHALDRMRENGDSLRPFIFSRWGGLGNHRYPIGFSGDTFVDWPTLHFQPYFTATAANVGYGWWSHDIGGHMAGIEDGELYARWVQFGLFSPILRLHSTNNIFLDRRPWGWDKNVYYASKKALQLRHEFIPYLYSMNWRTHRMGESLVRPLYHLHPEREEAYVCPQAYYFGTELISAPFTQPMPQDVGLSRQVVWLPEGNWYNFFTGDYYAGDNWYTIYGDLDSIPVFAKAGAIIPLAQGLGWSDTGNPAHLLLHIFPGENNRFMLYEDAGEGMMYMEGEASEIKLEQVWQGEKNREISFFIHPTVGSVAHLPAERMYELLYHGVTKPQAIKLLKNDLMHEVAWSYELAEKVLKITIFGIKPTDMVQVIMVGMEQSTAVDTPATIMHLLRHFQLDSNIKNDIARHLPELAQDPNLLFPYMSSLSTPQRQALLETITQSGMNYNSYQPLHGDLVIWNNHGRDDIQFIYHHRNAASWGRHQFTADQGPAPRFRHIRHTPPTKPRAGTALSWEATLHYHAIGDISLRGTETM